MLSCILHGVPNPLSVTYVAGLRFGCVFLCRAIYWNSGCLVISGCTYVAGLIQAGSFLPQGSVLFAVCCFYVLFLHSLFFHNSALPLGLPLGLFLGGLVLRLGGLGGLVEFRVVSGLPPCAGYVRKFSSGFGVPDE